MPTTTGHRRRMKKDEILAVSPAQYRHNVLAEAMAAAAPWQNTPDYDRRVYHYVYSVWTVNHSVGNYRRNEAIAGLVEELRRAAYPGGNSVTSSRVLEAALNWAHRNQEGDH